MQPRSSQEDAPSLTRDFFPNGRDPRAGRGGGQRKAKERKTPQKETEQRSRKCLLSERKSLRCFLTRALVHPTGKRREPGRAPQAAASGPTLGAAGPARPGAVASRPPGRACRHVCAHRQTHAGTRATVSAHVHACPAARLTSPSHGSVPPCPPRWPRPRRGPRHCSAPP